MAPTQQNPSLPRKSRVMPMPSAMALTLKSIDPESLLQNIPFDVAQQILDEWRSARSEPGMTGAGESTVGQYIKNAERLERIYSEENNAELGSLSPVELVRCLFSHAKELSPASWKIYRQSILHTMNRRAIEMDKQGTPQKSLTIALAGLIVASTKPMGDPVTGVIPTPTKRRRVKSITALRFEKLVTHLAVGFRDINTRARLTQSFAMATLVTGLRPSEWKNSKLRPATWEDVPEGSSIDGLLALDVMTAKRKAHDEEWMRTLLIEPGPYQIHLRQHYDALMLHLAKTTAMNQLNPDKWYNMHCSRTLKLACQQLWPANPERWITMYTLRSQARANFAATYGVFVAAAMLGHSPEKSSSYYAGLQRSNLPKGKNASKHSIAVPRPGPNVLAKAGEFELKASVRQNSRQLMEDTDSDFDEDDES